MLSSSAIEGIVAQAWQPGGKPSAVVVSATAYHYGACHSGNLQDSGGGEREPERDGY